MVAADLASSATELLLAPLDLLPPWLELLVISLLTAVIALFAMKLTTDQKKLERARDLMTSSIYEMRLFLDSPRRVLAAQGRLLRHSIGYTGRTLPAVAILFLPLTLLFVHLDLRFGKAPAPQHALVDVELDSDPASVHLELKGQGSVLGPVVEDRHAWFRIDLTERTTTSFDVILGDARATKLLIAAPAPKISTERVRGWESWFAVGFEEALPSDGPFVRIRVDHPAVDRSIFWMPWWATWLVISMVAAFALRKPMGVSI